MYRADFYDSELSRHNRHLRVAASVRVRDQVLDIGCGAGQTSREAARATVEGNVVGIDISAEMLEVARQRCTEEGLENVAFEQGDAQYHTFPAAHFDLCISRFGVMFFADPAAAFANIARAIRPGARLVWMVWQNEDRNQWAGAIRQAFGSGAAISVDVGKPFSLGDPAIATELLSSAGFTSIDFTDVHEPVFYGSNVDAAFGALTDLYCVRDELARANPSDDHQLQRLRDLLQAHLTPDGVLFDSRAWIVTAQKRSRS